jgi:hypothetical protein
LPARVDDALDDREQVEGRAGQAVDARDRHDIAGSQAVEHAEEFAAVGLRARHLLAVDIPAVASGGAKLLKLRVKRLPVGRDAGVPDEAFFQSEFWS